MSDLMDSLDPVYSILTSPNFKKDGLCFAARQSGFYCSEDAGLTWKPAYASLNLSEPIPTTSAVCSQEFPSDPGLFCGVPGGILRSHDSGKTWSSLIFPQPPPVISCLAISPDYNQDGTLFAGTMEDGIFRSADRGDHWATWNFGLLDLNVLYLAISPGYADDETLFAGTGSGIFISRNGGRAWREVNFPSDLAPVLSLALSADYPTSKRIFAGTEGCGFYVSQDNGKTWLRLGENAIPDSVNAILLAPGFPHKPEILVLSGDNLLISRDSGETWQDWIEGLEFDHGPTAVAAPEGLEPGSTLLVGLDDGGVLRV